MVYLVNCHIFPQLPKTLGVSTSMKEFIGRRAKRAWAMCQTSPGSLRPPTTWVDAIHQLFAMNLEVAQVYSEVRMKAQVHLDDSQSGCVLLVSGGFGQ